MTGRPEPQVMVTKETRFGGFSSLVFIIVAIVIIGAELIVYIDDNIQETKVLIPKVVLDEEVSSFIADKIYIEIELQRYGDKCETKNLYLTLPSAIYTSLNWTASLTNSKSCIVQAICNECILNIGAQLYFVSYEKFCYCSGINVNVTSSSSIPKEISSILLTLSPITNYVFIGSTPSKFYFTMIPSLFKSDSDKWPKNETGYHVSNQYITEPGSQYIGVEIVTASLLRVDVEFELSLSGMYTKRLFKQTPIFLISALIGSVFGILKAVGGVMGLIENYSQKILKKFKKVKRSDQITKNRIEFNKLFENLESNNFNSTN